MICCPLGTAVPRHRTTKKQYIYKKNKKKTLLQGHTFYGKLFIIDYSGKCNSFVYHNQTDTLRAHLLWKSLFENILAIKCQGDFKSFLYLLVEGVQT